jgi:hypothetical protein
MLRRMTAEDSYVSQISRATDSRLHFVYAQKTLSSATTARAEIRKNTLPLLDCMSKGHVLICDPSRVNLIAAEN